MQQSSLAIEVDIERLRLKVELKRIQNYLTRGGRLLVLLNNRTMGESSGIEELLSLWGVGVTNVPFDDNDASISGHSQELLVSIYSDGQSFHPIVSPLIINESAIKLFAPRVVLRQRLDSKGADAPKVEWIAFSSTNSVDAQGRRGSRPLAVTVEQGNIRGVTLDRGNTRIVVIGDSLCFDNLNYGAVANSYFAYNTASWLLNRPPILLKGLGPRRLKEYKLVLTAGQFRRVCWVLLAGLPGTVLLIGGLVSFSRRR